MLERFRWQILILIVGFILIGAGIMVARNYGSEKPKVEIIDDSDLNVTEILVEIVGEVASPGVYSLKVGSRVEDILILSGGLTSEADLDYVEKKVNRASRLSDGQKIYIPSVGESSTSSDGGTGVLGGESGLVNINSASQKELESLWGIGPVYAQNIIEQRPYSSVEELLSKKILKENVYERIKEQITAYLHLIY